MQFYTDEAREDDHWALPNAEVFHRTRKENREYQTVDGDGKPMPSGWYYWYCFPGCMPDSDPVGPYKSEAAAIAAAREECAE